MRLVVARIGRAHGIKGEVTIEVRTDVPEERFHPGAVLHVSAPPTPGSTKGGTAGRSRGKDAGTSSLPATLTLTAVRDHNGTLLLAFDGIDDRNGADALRGAILEADVPDTDDEPDAWYDHQLVGLRVVDPDGAALGEIVSVEHSPAQDLIVVKRPDGVRRLVPFVTAIVPSVDVAAGVVVVDAPPGLLADLD